MRYRAAMVVFLAGGLLASGCRTTVGQYFRNRGRDLGETVRLQAGAGLGIGASVSAAGLLDAGLSVSSVPRSAGIGWVYGDGHAFGLGEDGSRWESEVDLTLIGPVLLPILVFPGAPPPSGKRGVVPLHWRAEGTRMGRIAPEAATHACYAIAPAFFSGVGDADDPLPSDTYPQNPELDPPPFTVHPSIWSDEGKERNPGARIHVLDVEARLYLGVVYAKVGFSPGQFVDFVLGWFGADIAGDDVPLPPDVEA